MKPWQSIDADRLREMRASGMTVPDIARELGVSQRHVEYRCHELGIRAAVQRGLLAGCSRRPWDEAARDSSQALIRALRAAHPERCGGVFG